jgi:hypothetical protein
MTQVAEGSTQRAPPKPGGSPRAVNRPGYQALTLFGPRIPAKAANRHARADHAPGREHR